MSNRQWTSKFWKLLTNNNLYRMVLLPNITLFQTLPEFQKKLLIFYFYPMVWSLLRHWYLKLMYPIFYNICFCCLSICFSLRLGWQQKQQINFRFLSSSCLATGRHIFRIIPLVSYWVVQLQCKSVILKKNQQRNSVRSWIIIP